MKTRTLAALPLGVALLLACLLPAAGPVVARSPDRAIPPPGKATASVQEFVFLAEARPLLVRLHVRVDGRPVPVAWQECLDYLFGYLDVNKDGVLTKDEVERAPTAEQLAGGILQGRAFGGGGRGRPAPAATGPKMEEMDADNDGKVTRAELAAYYRKHGFVPFQFNFGAPANNPLGMAASILGGPRGDPPVEAVSKAIFNLLDTNHDGKLSKEELQAAPAVLLRLDEDEDEIITAQELVPEAGSNLGGIAGMLAMGRPGRQTAATSSPELVPVLTPGVVPPDLVRRLQERYGKGIQGDDKKLSRTHLGLDEATFRPLDANGDGVLDAQELAGFIKRAPDLELLLRLGKKEKGEAALQIVSPLSPLGRGVDSLPPLSPLGRGVDSLPPLSPRGRGVGGEGSGLADRLAVQEGLALLDLGVTRVELRGSAQDQADPFGGFLKQQFLAQFRQADTNGDGVLDADELQRSRQFRNLVRVLDRDGDGKVTEKELLAYLDHLQELQKRATAGCVTLDLSDQSRGLFDLLDVNRDGRLSVREMRQATKLLGKLDRGGKGHLTREDVPRSYRLEVRRGPAAQGNLGGLGAFASLYSTPTARTAAEGPRRGPVWFRKMDRNGDGDVSRKEFLFGEELFRRIDTDGDGLISLEEAEKAEALLGPREDFER